MLNLDNLLLNCLVNPGDLCIMSATLSVLRCPSFEAVPATLLSTLLALVHLIIVHH